MNEDEEVVMCVSGAQIIAIRHIYFCIRHGRRLTSKEVKKHGCFHRKGRYAKNTYVCQYLVRV